MGADQVGFLVVVPRRIGAKRMRRVAAAVKRRQLQWDKGVAECPNCGEQLKSDGAEHSMECAECGCVATRPEPEAVEKLLTPWPPDFRDVALREHPDSRSECLLFAGEMTWGDSPGGGGYETLDALRGMALWEALGIR